MSDIEALDRLISAVETGGALEKMWMTPSAIGISPNTDYFISAYNGSLDAALALHEALLPDDYVVSSDSTGFSHIWRDEHEATHNWTALIPGMEARSRLLVTLRAYRSQVAP